MIKHLKSIVKNNYLLRKYYRLLIEKYCDLRTHVQIINHGHGKFSKLVRGEGNKIEIGHNAILNKSHFRIIGNNNVIKIGAKCAFGPRCSFWMEGNNITITIGENCSMTHSVHINAQEDNSQIRIGQECMFSNNIIIRTSDSHPIFDMATNRRINLPKNIEIGNHVWIAPSSTIMKGAVIGDGAVIGSHTMVGNKVIEPNCLAVGMPAKIVKHNIMWTKEKLF